MYVISVNTEQLIRNWATNSTNFTPPDFLLWEQEITFIANNDAPLHQKFPEL